MNVEKIGNGLKVASDVATASDDSNNDDDDIVVVFVVVNELCVHVAISAS